MSAKIAEHERLCGRAVDLGQDDRRRVAAPTMPGKVRRARSFQSTLRCAMWLMPETHVVKVSTVWTPAEAAAGATPRLIRRCWR